MSNLTSLTKGELIDRIHDLEALCNDLSGRGSVHLPGLTKIQSEYVMTLHSVHRALSWNEIIDRVYWDRDADSQPARSNVGAIISAVRKIVPSGSIETINCIGYKLTDVGRKWVDEKLEQSTLSCERT